MLSSLCRSSDIDSARAFFNGIPDKDIVTWSTMLAGYFSHGRLADGLAFFRTMAFTTEFTADYLMLVTLLTAGASSGSLPPLFCRAIHGYVIRHRVPSGTHLGTSLIDCYAKDGRLDHASRVFARVPLRNVMHWTAMICGMTAHLRGFPDVRRNVVSKKCAAKRDDVHNCARCMCAGRAGREREGVL
jgi:pentatricopeptide repeat protein